MPARYGGFETAAEEIGRRLVERGHAVTVYCRGSGDRRTEFCGMRLVHLPTVHARSIETLSHTALSAMHVLLRRSTDVAVVFNVANIPFVPVLQAASVPVAVHVDGMEWQRGKWGTIARTYYRRAERLAVARADALIADSRAIEAYYDECYGAECVYLSYGAPALDASGTERIAGLGLEPRRYHLVVARLEPENQVDVILEAYRRSSAEHTMVIVGHSGYRSDYLSHLNELADGDPRIRMVGPVWDQDLLNELYGQATTYVHGHTVGGTNPSLLRAAALGAGVLAADVVFNREVLGEFACYFSSSDDLTMLLEMAEKDPAAVRAMGRQASSSVTARYRWDDVAAGYEALCLRLVEGRGRERRPRKAAATERPQS